MRKKIPVYSVFVIVVTCLLYMVTTSYIKLKKSSNRDRVLSTLTETAESLGIRIRDLDLPVVLVYFNSECDYCREELAAFAGNPDELAEIDLYLVSMEPVEQAVNFLKILEMEEYYMQAIPQRVMNTFTGIIPQTLLYMDGNLVKHYEGEVSTESVFKYIERISSDNLHKKNRY